MLRRAFLASAALIAFGPAAFAQEADIIDTLARTDGFSILVGAIEAAGLTQTLRSEGPFTVLAPTDDAFEALDPALLEGIMKPANREALAAVLSWHILSGKLMYDDITEDGEADTIAGLPIGITVDGDTKSIGNAVIARSDIEAANGVIHVPDRVIMPE